MKKKLLAVIMSLAMIASVTACGSSTNQAQTEQTQAEQTQTTDTAQSDAQAAATTAASVATISGTVTAAGSSALLPLAQAAAESFMNTNPDCSVVVNGGGSGEGLKQVSQGAVDIGNSDVEAEKKLDAAAAKALTDHQVCTITMAPVVNAALGVKSLTTDQLVSIFTGKTTNWKDVGGPDEAIMLVTRPSSSGTRALFKTWALNGAEEASNEALETDDSGTLLETVSNNPGAIGYVALSYLVNNDKVATVSIDGVAPTLENTYNGTYKVWGYEHMYTNGAGSDAAQAFINYMTGDQFSSQIETMGYGVATKMSAEAISAHAAK